MRLGSRCLWDAASDNFVSGAPRPALRGARADRASAAGSYESDTLFSSVQVYALYIE